MNNIQLARIIILAKDKKHVIRMLKKYRVPIKKSKYCWYINISNTYSFYSSFFLYSSGFIFSNSVPWLPIAIIGFEIKIT